MFVKISARFVKKGDPLEWVIAYIDGLVQERRNSIANALELRPSCTNPLIYAEENDCSFFEDF